MGLQNTAHYLKSKGRGKDTELVHMSPTEIKGLQALALAHGGSLTINPSTGLPEAGFLEDILPIVAAAGLTYLTAGAAAPMLTGALTAGGMTAASAATAGGILAGAGSGALISGGMAAVQGKDVGQAALMGGIGGGIAGGMGAYGDANVFGVGVPDAATQATQTAGIEAASTLNPQAGGFQQVAGDQLIPTEQGNLLLPGGSAQSSVNIGPNIPEQFAPGTPSTFASTSSSTPPSYYSQLGSGAMDTAKKIGIQGLPALGVLQADQNMPGEQEDEYTRRLKRYRLSPNYKAYEAPRPNPYYRPSYAAEGGVMSSFDDEAGSDTVGMARGGIYKDEDPDTRYKDALSASMIRLGKAGQVAGIKPRPLPKMSISGIGDVSGAFPKGAGGGEITSSLGGYSDGGRMLKGPGDGMSDSIPGVIGGKQPARLADGEFVVPADVVSHLGNGSTDAGAKKLYSMMDKIRQARTGKKKQAPQVNTEKYLPIKKKASGGIAGYAAGGITGYAEGGALQPVVQQVTNQVQNTAGTNSAYSNEQVASFITNLQAKGGTESDIVREAIRYGIPAKQISDATSVPLADISNKIVDQLYIQQIGRAPDEEGRKFYTSEIAKGKTPAQIASELNRSLEGQEFDTQFIESQYIQNYARTADQEGYQYYMSLAQSDPLMFDAALKEAITKGTKGEADAAKLAAKGSGYTNLELASLEADPFGGRKPTKSIYDILPDAENVSTIGGQKVQFVNPATQRGIVSQFNQNFTDKAVSDYIQGKLQGVDVNDPVALQQANRSIYQDALSNNVSPEQISRVLPYTVSQIQQYGTENLGKTLQSQFSATQGKDVLNAPAAKAAVDRAIAAGTLNQADYSTLLADLDAAKDNPDAIRAAYAKPRAQKVVDAIYGQQIGEAKTLADAQAEATQRQAVLSAQDPGYYQSNQQLASAYKSAGLNYPFGQEAYQGYDTRVGAKNVVTPQNVRQQAGLAINELQRNNPYRTSYQPINRGIANMPESVQDPYSDAGLKVLYGQMMNQYAPAPPGQMNPATFTPGPTYAYTPPAVNNLTLQNPIPDAVTAEANQAKADADAAKVVSPSGDGGRAGGLMSIDRKKRAKPKYKK